MASMYEQHHRTVSKRENQYVISSMTALNEDMQNVKEDAHRIGKKIELLEDSRRKLLGNGLETCSVSELLLLENQLERSLSKIRARKNQLFWEQIEKLREEERRIEEENTQLRLKQAFFTHIPLPLQHVAPRTWVFPLKPHGLTNQARKGDAVKYPFKENASYPCINGPIPPMPNLPSPRMNGPALLPSPTSQFLLPSPTDLLPTQGQTSQPQPQQQQLMSQMQSRSTQLQQQQPNQLQRDMQQRLKASAQTSRNLFQSQNMIDQQKQLYRSQIAVPETSSRCWAMMKDDFLASLKKVLDSLYPNNMTNESFQDVNEHLIPDILHMYGEKDEIERMNEKSVRLSRHTVGMKLLIDEIKYLKDKNEQLATKNDKLTSEIIKMQLRLPNKGLEQILQTEESHNSPSKSHGDYPSVQQFCDVEIDYACYGDNLSVDQQLGDLEMNDGFSDTSVSIDDNSKSFRSGISPTQSAMYEFLKKLEADVTGDVKLSNFSNLEGELIKIGRYNFPSSLITMVERIKTFHGDVSVNVKVNRSIAEAVYVMFCAVIKEMDDLQLGEISEDKMLKWRDLINDALRLGFNVGFAMEHLKKIARAYFGLKPTLLLKSKISKLEGDLEFYKENHEFLDSIHATQKFLGENAEGIAPFSTLPVSTGLFIMPSAC